MMKNILIILIFGILGSFLACEKHQNRDVFSESVTSSIDSLLKKADYYRNVDIDSMLLLSTQATDISRDNDYEKGYLKGLLQQSIAYFYKGEDVIALSKIRKIEACKPKKDEEIVFILAKKNSLRGSIYHNRALYDSAAIYMFNALQIFEKYDKELDIAMVSANIAANYITLENNDKALEFTQKSALSFQKENYEKGVIAIYERMGSIYSQQEQYDSALFYFQNSLELAEKVNHVYFIANGYHNVGSVYLKQNQFEVSQRHLQKAIDLFQEQENLLGYTMTLSRLAQLDLNRKRYQTALSKYQTVNDIALENDFLSLREESHEKLSEIYKYQRSFELALKHNQDAQIIHDSINNSKRLARVNKLENQYLTAQKNKVILEQEVVIQTSQNRGLILLLVSIVIIAISFFIIYKRWIENKLLVEKNDLIKNQQLELKHRTTNQLEQLNDLFTIYGFMNEGDTEVLKEAESRIEAINLVYRYLENNQEYSINIQPFIEKLVENILVIYGMEKEDVEVETAIVDIKMDANKIQIIGQIINEILNNTFKHAFETKTEHKKIFVGLSKLSTHFELVVSDNGQGFDPEIEKMDRMGLSLITAFVKSIKGKMTMETGSSGTKYIIEFF